MNFNNFNLLSFILIIKKWYKKIFVTTFIALVISAFVSFLLPNYYKSTVKFYPYTIKASDPRMAFSMRDYEVMGEDEDFERIISIGTSRKMYEFLTNKFNLFEHYEIDSSKTKYPYTELSKELEANYIIRKTDKGIEVSVYDKDPKFASQMANTIITEIERINVEVITGRNVNMVSLYKNFVEESHNQIKLINDTIIKLREGYSLDDFSAENQILAYNQRGSKIKTYNVVSNEETMSLKKNFEVIKKLDTRIQELSKELAQYELMYNQSVSAVQQPFKTLVIIEEAVPSEKKVKPLRTVIVLITTILALIFSVLAVLCIEYYNSEIKEALSK